MSARPRRARSVPRIFALPALLAVATTAGLVLGLTGDGAPDILSWSLLSLPPLAVALAWARRDRAA